MTTRLYETHPYMRGCDARVTNVTTDSVGLDQTIFYPTGGGQPGDTGRLIRATGETIVITDTVKRDGTVHHIRDAASPTPDLGEVVRAQLDWDRRFRHMRLHTCLHLLSALIDAPVTGGNIGTDKARLDFDLPAAGQDKQALTEALNALIERDIECGIEWITDAELDAAPQLVKTMSVQPPRGAGRIRLVRVPGVDLQPCGGTHVARTGEIGRVEVIKIEKKSKHNRRFVVALAPP